ncbi:MAG TPA: pyrroloquinoline quinone-dependent dehydrogenase [Pseudomonadales bacterium]|nr:pyrroloquinoline quinone-dependent dehydrogenase [Pseudomonadales bacterium]
MRPWSELLSPACALSAALLLTGAIAVSAAADGEPAPPPTHYGMDIGGSGFSPAAQITPANVARLEVAWVHHSGDLGQGFRRKGHTFEATPVLSRGRLYFSTSSNLVIAVDAGSGAELWRFDPRIDREIAYAESASRGVSLWRGTSATCPERVFAGTLAGELHALDAATGRPCEDFGEGGRVDLAAGAGKVRPGEYTVTSPPAVLGDRIVVGSAIGDNQGVELERGIVRALDARSGEVLWVFDPIPLDDDDPAAATWSDDSFRRTGAANAWAPLSADVERGLVFVPTSSPSPDFYGGERLGDNRHANSVVALDVETGALVWERQLVHHDVWDYDTPMQPTLVDLPMAGGVVPAVVIGTKHGMVFTFHRETGADIHPVSERPVPASDVPGERLSPTQPFSSLPPIADQSPVTPDDAFGLLYFDRRWCAAEIAKYRSEGVFTPPSLQGSVMNPSWAGGANWGGVSVNPAGVAVVNVNQLPGLVKLFPRAELQAAIDSGTWDDWDFAAMEGTPYGMARRLFTSPLGLPCTQPPWGRLLALDLVAGELLWARPLGSIRDYAPVPIPDFGWGMLGIGGTLQTGGGLIFVGAVAEHAFRAFDVRDGELLWETRLPTAAIATPMSYELDGVQYVVIAVGGHWGVDLPRGDALMAFRLPAAD